jgi:hypothetical protein
LLNPRCLQIEELFLRYDLNHDGHINFKEFVFMMSSPPWVNLFPRSAAAALVGMAGDLPESPGSPASAEPKSPIRTNEVRRAL